MQLNKEEKLNHEANNTCHICSETYINKVRDHSHETGYCGRPVCNTCNLRYKRENFIPVKYYNGYGYDFNLIYSELFKQNNDKRKVDNIPIATGLFKIFIGFRMFLDSYNFLAMSLDGMPEI